MRRAALAVSKKEDKMGYISALRESIEDEMRVKGHFDKVQNILFLHRTDHNSDIYAVKGNNNRLLAIAEVEEDNEIGLYF